MRMVTRGPHVGAAIMFDDGWWWAVIDDVEQQPRNPEPFLAGGVTRVWESGERISHDDYRHLLALSRWAKEHDRTHPLADPTQPVRVGKMKPPF